MEVCGSVLKCERVLSHIDACGRSVWMRVEVFGRVLKCLEVCGSVRRTVSLLNTLSALHFADDFDVLSFGSQHLPHGPNVLSRADEGGEDDVHILLHAEQ